ncbi:unnamed protein product [Symbiodinium natans]|uniref:Uncharacterized protein n=1 Tax=Symbiodinium natans TaxID=878477 RepID=A0A812INY5_9DINO|nr:unnamed protein product [Symbiodinium natans]
MANGAQGQPEKHKHEALKSQEAQGSITHGASNEARQLLDVLAVGPAGTTPQPKLKEVTHTTYAMGKCRCQRAGLLEVFRSGGRCLLPPDSPRCCRGLQKAWELEGAPRRTQRTGGKSLQWSPKFSGK